MFFLLFITGSRYKAKRATYSHGYMGRSRVLRTRACKTCASTRGPFSKTVPEGGD